MSLRLLTVADAPRLERAVVESLEHLRPWMAWAALEPLPLEQRRLQLSGWQRDWRAGGDAHLGVFLDGALIGGFGLHRRIGPAALEIGYWLHPEFTGRGLATHAAAIVTRAGLAHPGITHVEIRHDKANQASGRIPRRLGYKLVAEVPEPRAAPGEIGIECRWRRGRGGSAQPG